MGEFDPVSWDEIEAALGPPAAEVEDYVDRMADELAGANPYDAVKAVHDAIDQELGAEGRSVPGLGEVFVTAYLLERRGVVDADGSEYPSLVARRPSDDRLEELVRERERTLWWIGILTGVHPTLVTYWCYEADVPLLERNLGPESMAAVRAVRGDDPE